MDFEAALKLADELRNEAMNMGGLDDPESWHIHRDDVYLAALQAVEEGHPRSSELVAAALKLADQDVSIWFA